MQKQQAVGQSKSLNLIIIAVLDNLRAQLSARGANSIRGLARVFKSLDSYNGNRKVDAQEFYVGLKEIGVTVSKQDIDVNNNSS